MYVMSAGAINHIGHRDATRPYQRSATNVTPLALATGGEALHNNDRGAPTSARCSLRPGEDDPGWSAVRTLVSIPLPQVHHDDLHLTRTA